MIAKRYININRTPLQKVSKKVENMKRNAETLTGVNQRVVGSSPTGGARYQSFKRPH
jgi:hypothetical protein